ncbi:Uncharacterised protein [Bifidobacterium adolescentis]|nr:Uncharacterised protein [Bifidobacterium adolescentis]
MRGEDHVVLVRKVGQELVAGLLRFDWEHVHRRAGQMAGIQMLLQRVQIRHETTGQVDEDGILLHMLELVFAEESRVRLASIHMKRDHIGLFQQFVERVATVGVAHGELLFNVVEQHAHAKRLGDDGKLGADVAVADDAERLASDLMGAGGGLIPHAVLHMMGVRGNAAHQADDVADHQLHHGTGIRIRRVEDGDAVLARVFEIHLVGANAEAADRGERRTRVDDLAGHTGLGTDAEQVDTFQRINQLVLAQGSLEALDLEAMVAQRLRRVGMDVFK